MLITSCGSAPSVAPVARKTSTGEASPSEAYAGSCPAAEPSLASLRSIASARTIEISPRIPSSSGGWIEKISDKDSHFPQRDFLPSQKQHHREIVNAFGTATPPSGDVLLHYAGDPPAGVEKKGTPVVLVHGAKVDGSFWWRGEKGGVGEDGGGLAQTLRKQGLQVFAVTFAHNQDDNFCQAQALANAVERARQVTGKEQVDLVGHSKGCIPATVMATPGFREDWMSAYKGDVRRLLLLGGPNGGIDYFHRHPNLDKGANNWPMVYTTVHQQDCSGFQMGPQGHWPGQAQLAKRFDAQFPVWDKVTYEGGSTGDFEAPGIDAAIRAGGNFMEKLHATPIAKGVEVGLLAGNHANLGSFQNETDGPSDGIILVDSALQAPKDAAVRKSELLPLNHLELAWSDQAQHWVGDFLAS